MSRRLTLSAPRRYGWALIVCLLMGCAGDLLVRAPERLPPIDPAALGELSPIRISVGAVANVPDMALPVGMRGAAPLQPGGPIHLTEDAGSILRRTVMETLQRAGHRVVAQDAAVHVALRFEEFTVDAPREGIGWEVSVRLRLVLRVSTQSGDGTWDELSASADRTLRTAWRPDVGTVEPVLRACLQDLGTLLAGRGEFSAALARHSDRGPAS